MIHEPGYILLEKYQVIQLLGTGGWGDVYKATDLKLGREVAIKHLKSNLTKDEVALKRFLLEAKTIAKLNHPNIVTIHAFEQAGDDHYIVMEYAEQGTLEDLLETTGPLPVDQVVDMAVAICRALVSVHSHQIIHRDIKPSNILLFTGLDEELIPKLADFGLARTQLSHQSPRLTQEYTVMGTVAYMAPEQARGEEVDARSDIYSLGVLLYTTLTGKVPYEGTILDIFSIFTGQIKKDPIPVNELRGDVSATLNQLIMKALSIDPAERFQTARAMAEAFKSYKGEKTAKENISSQTQSRPPLLVMLFFNLVALGLLAILWGPRITSRCISSIGAGLGVALITLELLHLIWRYLGETLLELNIPISSYKIQVGQLGVVFNYLHPRRRLPGNILWIQAFIFIAIAGYLLLPFWSPFHQPEQVPNIQNFIVYSINGDNAIYVPGDLLQAVKNTKVRIEAKSADQSDILCTWSTTKGSVLPEKGCTTQYSPPVRGNSDTLSVLAESACKMYQASATLHIQVILP